MKKIVFLIILITFSVRVLAQKKNEKTFHFKPENVEKSIAKINENLYASMYEVSNAFYKDFENDFSQTISKDELKLIKPDTSNWMNDNKYLEPMAKSYHSHPAFDNYPVVNISYEAAVMYCKWLTEQYNANPKRKFKKVVFRLPTIIEWEYAAKGGLENTKYPWGNFLFQNNYAQCNFKRIGDESLYLDSATHTIVVKFDKSYGLNNSLSDNADITAPVNAYFENGYGLYNMSGNVAEMVDIKGFSKGGSWKCLGGDVSIQSNSNYKKIETDLGFRYFMEILEN